MRPTDTISVFAPGLIASGIEWMVAGGVAAIVYGEPRLTQDLDIVAVIDPATADLLAKQFPEGAFYCPPVEVIVEESRRDAFGHFNLLHLESAARADVYLAGGSALARRGLDQRRTVSLAGMDVPLNLPRFSPDGRWIAYQSNESGRIEIYVRPFPGAGARVQVSTEGGTVPVWARSGRALFYRTAAGIVSVAVTTGATFSLGDRRVVLPGAYLTDPTHANYDVSTNGSQFLMLKQAGAAATPIVVNNWGRELREKLGAGKN